MSAEAEAFRASLRTGRGDATSSFADWRRQQQPRRVLVWALRLALISPGLLCFLIQAPLEASVGLEVAGVLSNVWIRRERQRHLRAIASWDPEA